MASSKQLRQIARNPKAHMHFVMSGRLPEIVTPKSPLIDLLTRISPRDRAAIIGLTVGPKLGYSGSRQFHTAEAALRWIRPDTEMLAAQSWPAESWRDKRFAKKLTLDDLLAAAASSPPKLRDRYPQLCQPRPLESGRTQEPSSEESPPDAPAP